MSAGDVSTDGSFGKAGAVNALDELTSIDLAMSILFGDVPGKVKF